MSTLENHELVELADMVDKYLVDCTGKKQHFHLVVLPHDLDGPANTLSTIDPKKVDKIMLQVLLAQSLKASDAIRTERKTNDKAVH